MEITATTETASNSNPPRSAGRSDQGAVGALVGRLFAEHGRMVLGLCRLLLRDPVEAEDAAQQVFLSAHKAVLRGSPPREEHAWLAAIARNECRARIHARMREPLALPDLPSDLPDPLAAAIRATDLEAIWAAISSLPRRQRRALVLREVGGLSYHELGQALGVSQSSVESLLFRARRQVRGLVAAASPLALRDDLARLIPGFDPGNAGLAARVVSLPLALKLATAAVSVGVVTTGAGQFPQHHPRPQVNAQTKDTLAGSAPIAPIERTPTVLARQARRPVLHAHAARHDDGGRSGERRHREAEPADEAEHGVPEPEPADLEPAEVEPPETEASHDGSHSPGVDGSGSGGGSGSDGSGSSGSDHSGSSGGDSQPDPVDH
jgi:RNA polymerase sigma factor (sigma-70 family)